MTIEIIPQARGRLEQLRDESTQGVWSESGWDGRSTSLVLPGHRRTYGVGGSENVELVVTLHRTIDAQIEVLEYAEELIRFYNGNMLGLPINPAISLAKAIMGVE